MAVAVRSPMVTRASWRVEVAVRKPWRYVEPSGEGPVAMATWRWAFGVMSEMPASRVVVPGGSRASRSPMRRSASAAAVLRAAAGRPVGMPCSSRGCFAQAAARSGTSKTIRLYGAGSPRAEGVGAYLSIFPDLLAAASAAPGPMAATLPPPSATIWPSVPMRAAYPVSAW